MRLLLDSHTLLWHLSADSRLSSQAEKEISEAAEVYVSIATLWELSIKYSLGKLSLSQPPGACFPKQLETNGFVVLEIKPEHIFLATGLPRLSSHKNPFDRMLVGQAKVEQLHIVSGDVALDEYGVNRLW